MEDFLSLSVAIVFTKTTSLHSVTNAAEIIVVLPAFRKTTDENKQIFVLQRLCKAALMATYIRSILTLRVIPVYSQLA